MDKGYIIAAVLAAIGIYLLISGMRSRRKRWEEMERERAARQAQREQDEETLREAIANNMVSSMHLPSIAAVQKAKAAALAAEYANRVGQAAASRQADLSRQQFNATRMESRIAYNVMKDQWEDAYGNVVPKPTTYFNPDAFDTRLIDPRRAAGISATQQYDDEQQRRRRHDAVEAAMIDCMNTGLGVVFTDASGNMEHIPEAEFRGGGGSFDGGGASGDYTPAESSCNSSSTSDTSSSDSGSSCSSSDSGGGSSSSD